MFRNVYNSDDPLVLPCFTRVAMAFVVRVRLRLRMVIRLLQRMVMLWVDSIIGLAGIVVCGGIDGIRFLLRVCCCVLCMSSGI